MDPFPRCYPVSVSGSCASSNVVGEKMQTKHPALSREKADATNLLKWSGGSKAGGRK